MQQRIYLDNAATTAAAPRVVEAILPYFTQNFGNPSSIYSYGREARIAIELARKSVSSLLGAKPAEIVFTSGGTESNNLAIRAAVEQLGCLHIITSRLEHHAVLNTVQAFGGRGTRVSYVAHDAQGNIDLEDLERLLSQTRLQTLVTLMHANNEIGTLTDIEEVSRICATHGAYFHTDAVQTIGHYPIDCSTLGVHFVSASGHKFHGPKGAGILFVSNTLTTGAMVHGGGQESGRRAGTENVAGIVGFAKALEIAHEGYDKNIDRISLLKQYLMVQLPEHIPGVSFNGNTDSRSLYSVLSINIPKAPGYSSLLFDLDAKGICVSGGSACNAANGSHVIAALGISTERFSTVRISFSANNTTSEIDTLVNELRAACVLRV